MSVMSRFLIALVFLLTCSPVVLADTEFSTTQPDFLLTAPTNVSKKLRLETAFDYVGGADFSNGLGGVEVFRTSLSVDYSIFKLSYMASDFAWTHTEGVAKTFSVGGSLTPWDILHDFTLQARLLNDTVGDRWRYWVNGEVASSFETTFPGAVGVGFDGGIAYDFWQGWMLGLTARTVALSPLNQDLLGEAEIGLAVAVSQKALRRTLQSLGLSDDVLNGSDAINFSFAVSRVEKTYRLDSGNSLYQSGYLGVVHSKAGLYLDYAPNEDIVMSIGPEYHYLREYRLYNSAGSYQSSHKLDNAFGGYVRVLWKF
ncbi:hypothetical protein SYK_19170 [Pseudodesulfovibrio nedwellii]|uniref:DUF3187 family protein n=2 Tax=Pseudodesulfovibrio nedwellii TaxID=2973072 RepID=A0ABM8B186_9BACT|nr:hypothetical protein [Pseudodesulfovibrio sp.]BDQ37557.1 hypothetical protein SYK_19170 [Pseudodesulfovibrio nedwellii]